MFDAILGIGGFVLVAGLLPSFRRGNRPHVKTSTINAIVITAFATVYALDGKPVASFSAFLTAAAWYTLTALKKSEQ